MSETVLEQDVKRIAFNQHSTWSASTSPHHAESHTLLGANHTASGLTTGDILEATAATTFGMVRRLLRAYKDADSTITTNDTLADDGHLTMTLEASSRYRFQFIVFANNANAAEGLKVALGGTVGVTALKAQVKIYDDVSNAIAGFARVTALAGAISATLSAGDSYTEINGAIETSTAGTLLLSRAQGVSGANALTIQRNSNCWAMKV